MSLSPTPVFVGLIVYIVGVGIFIYWIEKRIARMKKREVFEEEKVLIENQRG